MSYRVSKHMDVIRKAERRTDKSSWSYLSDSLYEWFDTYEEAKQFCINRAENRIKQMEADIKRIKRQLPKLRAMAEKVPNSDLNVQGSVATDVK